MLKKLVFFTGWLVMLCLSLLFCLTLGLWQNWSTPEILLLWLFMLVMVVLLWGISHTCIQLIKEQKGRRWPARFRLSRREYVLLKHWKTGASVIKRIRRNRHRLPWFLLVGERCGKSSLLAGARLPQFYGEIDEVMPAPTRTLRWWFFRNLCILEVSSNFLNGAKAFRQGWRKLAQWCTKMPPPAGIIITLSIGELLNEDRRHLHESGRKIRALIEPLIRRFGEQLPIHIMITQCDRLPGFSLWHKQLSVMQKMQPLGYQWVTPSYIDGDDPDSLQPLFNILKQGFSWSRLSMDRPQCLNSKDYLELLDFPEKFSSLEPMLRYFLASLCEPNAYFSNTSLSSVWFSSSELQENNSRCRESIFTHSLLSEGLGLLSQHNHQLRWYHRTRGKILGSVLLVILVFWIGSAAIQVVTRIKHSNTGMQPDELAEFLKKSEQQSASSLSVLPFAPVLRQQLTIVKTQLEQISATPHLLSDIFRGYRQRTLAASPEQQREYILRLANAIEVWQGMRDNAQLLTLERLPPVVSELQQYSYPATTSALTQLAFERSHMQSPEGEQWLRAARTLLINLVNHDPSMNWLQSPSEQMPSLHISTYWPSLSESEDIVLPGIWTQQGDALLTSWMMLIEHAAGGGIPAFQQFRERRIARKQDVWGHFLINTHSVLSASNLPSLTHGQLIELSQNKSQAMLFVNNVVKELSDISSADAQPWLTALRQLNRVSLASDNATILSKAEGMDLYFRKSLTAWLHNKSMVISVDTTKPIQESWRQWENTRNEAVNEVILHGKASDRLSRGILTTTGQEGKPNPLLALTPALTRLRESTSGTTDDTATAAVWTLYQEDVRRLLDYAILQTSCWLNDQWKTQVIWPLNKDAESRTHDEQQVLSQQYVTDFLKGPAKNMLTVDSNRLAPALFEGVSVPLTDEFLRFARQMVTPDMLKDVPQRDGIREGDQRASLQAKLETLTPRLADLEKKKLKITLSSMPATVPEGARVIPTGTQLLLHCQNGDQQMNSMNFAEKAEFIWQPGNCEGVTLGVQFPDFTVHYQLNSEDSWPVFINRFSNGEALLDSDEFGSDAGLLKQLGIEHVLIRFNVADTQETEDAEQSWSNLKKQIADINAEITSLDERIHQQSKIALSAPVSALPSTIAQCH